MNIKYTIYLKLKEYLCFIKGLLLVMGFVPATSYSDPDSCDSREKHADEIKNCQLH